MGHRHRRPLNPREKNERAREGKIKEKRRRGEDRRGYRPTTRGLWIERETDKAREIKRGKSDTPARRTAKLDDSHGLRCRAPSIHRFSWSPDPPPMMPTSNREAFLGSNFLNPLHRGRVDFNGNGERRREESEGRRFHATVELFNSFKASIYDYSRHIRLQQSRNKDVNIKAFAKLLKSKGRS
ncbi:myosin heavy chain [Corchorus capsularis]|uniref:Myosin heavy chain n=1 Tax=Corchorus capsularis TaxID=210143 RepID=A0A1R3GMY5_COCAP|nr:myosin heavy chain [Corchorus capsularis]